MIEKRWEQDKIEIIRPNELANIQVRLAQVIYENGVEISRTYVDRQVFSPDMDLDSMTTRGKVEVTPQLKEIAKQYWTGELKAKRAEILAEE